MTKLTIDAIAMMIDDMRIFKEEAKKHYLIDEKRLITYCRAWYMYMADLAKQLPEMALLEISDCYNSKIIETASTEMSYLYYGLYFSKMLPLFNLFLKADDFHAFIAEINKDKQTNSNKREYYLQ